ncbi:MAG: hypothetical protein KatS3mg027_0892 [Bacteroidia bacterium]|nr:MAG: hypothetical protein KatS3mg027_0892 [Bacteroidia bacterium]
MSFALYFLAIVPPPELSQKIHQIKNYIAQKYNCKHALKSPPHITIEPPFRFPPAKEALLIQNINHLNQQLQSLSTTIYIKDYDVFLPKVVFIKVLDNPELHQIYKYTHHFVKSQLKIIKDLPPRPFHPHITIAFRDVKKQYTLTILEELKTNFPIQDSFQFQKLFLLKHNGQYWEVIN